MNEQVAVTTGANPSWPIAPCLDCGYGTVCDIRICSDDEFGDFELYGYCDRCGGMAVEGCPVPEIVTGSNAVTIYAMAST